MHMPIAIETQAYRNNFIYCGIPKNGCSHWRRMMHRAQGFNDAFTHTHGIHRPPAYLSNLTTLSHLAGVSINQARRVANSRDFFSFVIVRNPYSRLLSAWIDKRKVLATHIHDYDIKRLEVSVTFPVSLTTVAPTPVHRLHV